ncbi:phosphatidylglycerophosphatase A [Halomonas sp.]|uniref:phosphatidylglycerophosphatase A family protein n=1 Tax=Halomonas sp. TaxID=1486246 RepID=UPI00356433C8
MSMETLTVWIATGFGLGHLPWAPGTVGSLLGLPLAWWILGRSRQVQLGVSAMLLVIGVPVCHVASAALGGGDVQSIVADEFLAFPVAVLGLAALRRPWAMAGVFVIYRFFDITKPPPINQLESLGGGLGIMLDDTVAALYTWLVLVVCLLLWRRWHARRA